MSEVLSDREAEIFYAEQRGYASAMEAERKLHEDHIKAQAAEIERLRDALAKAGRDLNVARYGQPDFAWSIALSIHKQEMADLVDKLAKAVEALQIARVHVANNAEGWSVSRAPSRDDLTIVDSILSALTGAQKDGN